MTNDIRKSVNRKVAGLTLLEVFLYLVGMPMLVVLTAVFSVQFYQMVPYYTFWPFVGVILAGVLCLVFFIVLLCVTRKKSRKTIRRQTIALIVTVVCLTFLVGALVDVLLPDILSSLTSGTLKVEDLENNYEEQAETNAFLVRRFVMYNIANGNYSADYAYETLVSQTDTFGSDMFTYNSSYLNQLEQIISNSDPAVQQEKYDALIAGLPELQQEYFEFVYTSWVLRDPAYMLNSPTAGSSIGNIERLAVGLAVSKATLSTYTKLAQEGMSNKRISYLFNKNYASMHNDGYVTYDDSLILYAQSSGRMTVPVVLRLILDQSSDFSEDSRAVLDENNNLIYPTYEATVDGQKVEAITSMYYELYMADAVKELFNDYSHALVKVNNYENTYYVDPAVYEDNEVSRVLAGAVVVPCYNDSDELIGGYVSQPMKWGILDMDGKTMAVTSLDVSGLLGGALNTLIPLLAEIEVGDVSIVEGLLDGLGNVLYDATGGRPLSLGLCINDSGLLEINIFPMSVTYGVLGYQDMTWLQSNNLLCAVISVMSLRNWLYIVGAIALVTVFAASCCREFKLRIKKDAEEAAAALEPATETAGAAADAAGAAPVYDEETPAYDDAAPTYGEETPAYGDDAPAADEVGGVESFGETPSGDDE